MTYRFHIANRAWQQRAFDESKDAITWAYLFDPGMGKTKVTLDVASHNFGQGKLDTLIVVAPNGVHDVWVEQAAVHIPHVPHRAIAWRTGLVNREFLGMAASPPKDRFRIFTVNIEAAQHSSGVQLLKGLLGSGRAMLVVDEAHKIRTPGAKRTRALWRLGESAVMRRILTGTAVIKGLENLYAPYRFLHPAIIGCKTYTDFKGKYCLMRGEWNEIYGYQNQEDLLGRIMRRTSLAYEAEMGLEEPVVSTRYTVLSAEQKRIYKSLRETYMAELASGALVEAPLVINRLMKFQQLVAGHVRLEPSGWEPVPTPRIEDAVDVIGNAPSKILVWASFQPDVEQLATALKKEGISHTTYYGANGASRNRTNLGAFKTDPSVHAFLATRSSGGTGLTLNEAKHTLNYTHSYDTENVWQAAKRNHRLGQDSVVHVTNLVARGTIDVTMLAVGARDAKIAAVLRNPKELARMLESWLDGNPESS